MGNEANKLVDDQQMNWGVLESYLRQQIDGIPNEPLQVEKFSEGYSNLTYMIKFGNWEAVLRRPPFGQIPPRAHDMFREYQVLAKLNPVFPYAPKPYVYCEDKAVMDKHFYVMEKKNGYVIDDVLPETYGSAKEVGPIISENMLKTVHELHCIDFKEVGLSDFGKPEGFLERQVFGWIKRYDHSKTDDYSVVPELEQWLKANYPKKSDATIVHNDFKLNNVVFDKQNIGEIIGVLDWELSTLGDPMTDIGSMAVYWGDKNDPELGINVITDQEGFYNRRELIEHYARISGRDMSDIVFYVSFGFYKLAVILQQIYYRWSIGEVDDDRFKTLNVAIGNLLEMANLVRKNQVL